MLAVVMISDETKRRERGRKGERCRGRSRDTALSQDTGLVIVVTNNTDRCVQMYKRTRKYGKV